MTQLTKAFDAPSYADLKQTLEEQMGSMSAERYINFYNKFAQKTDPNGTRYADLFTPQQLKQLMRYMDVYDMEDRSRQSRLYNVRNYFALYDTFKDVPGMADAFQDRELSEYCIERNETEGFFRLQKFLNEYPETYKKFRQEWQERAAPSSQCASQMNLAL
jgi:hypothetical protein